MTGTAHGSTLVELADDYWSAWLERHPTAATALGDRRFDDRLSDESEAARDAWRAQLDGFSRRLAETAAVEFMTAHTALGLNNIGNEVDRYIAYPGQALAYKVGQLELLRLRAEARTRQGPRFDIRRFHDVVLGEGALPLPVLRQVVERALA